MRGACAALDNRSMPISPRDALRAACTLVLLAAACSDSSTATPEATTTAIATTQASATVVVTGTTTAADDDLAARRSEVERAVVAIRQLEPGEGTPASFVSSAEIAATVSEELAAANSIATLERDERLYRLLGALEPGEELADVYDAYLGEAVLGLYDPSTGTLLVRADGGFGLLAEVTYAHEYVHYLQDTHFDLLELLSADLDRDAMLALRALIEGDASAAQLSYMFRALDADELSELATETLGIATPEAGETPRIAKATIEFPYLAGFIFAVDLRADGGNAALDAAFAEPPTTTEQVLHSEKYLAGEGAHAVEPPRLELLGPGWSELERDVIGELTLRSWLEALEAPRNDAIRAGAGWGGDAYLVARSDQGDLALLARIAWDEPATDAEELVRASRPPSTPRPTSRPRRRRVVRSGRLARTRRRARRQRRDRRDPDRADHPRGAFGAPLSAQRFDTLRLRSHSPPVDRDGSVRRTCGRARRCTTRC